MTDEEWNQHFARCLGVYLSAGEALDERDERGRPHRRRRLPGALQRAPRRSIPFTLPGVARWTARARHRARRRLPRRRPTVRGRTRVSARRAFRACCCCASAAMRRRHDMPFGAGWSRRRTRFRLWAPAARRVELRSNGDEMRARRWRLPTAGSRRSLARRRRHALPLPHRRRPGRARSRRRAATPTTCTAPSEVVDPRLRLARRRLARTAVARGGGLRAARRHVHAGRHLRRGVDRARLSGGLWA